MQNYQDIRTKRNSCWDCIVLAIAYAVVAGCIAVVLLTILADLFPGPLDPILNFLKSIL